MRRSISLLRRIHSTSNLNARVLCSDPIEEIAKQVLEKEGHEVDIRGDLGKNIPELLKVIGDYEGLIVRSGTKVTEEVIEAGKKLKLIGRAGTGYDNINVKAASRKGILVMNTPGGNTTSAAELTMSLIMTLSRNIPQACSSLKKGKWDRKSFTGSELSGKTIGIVGLGRIGREVAKWCSVFGMNVIGYDPIMSAEAAKASGIESKTLEELYDLSDYITLHTPLTADTKYLINEQTLKKCKTGVKIINCARGGILDEQALLHALNSGKVGGAALDVFEKEPPKFETLQPLIDHPKVICTPHLGASTVEAQIKVAHDIAQQFNDAFAGGPYVGVVNAPSINLARRPELLPYMQLAEKLGSLQAQLLGKSKLDRFTIIFSGKDVADATVSKVLGDAAMKGLLGQMLQEEVNLINAPYLAEELGIDIVESREKIAENYENLISLEIESDAGNKLVSGTIYHEDVPRIVQIDNFKVDISPEGEMLFFRNKDAVGLLHRITSVLAANNINVANFCLGRDKPFGEALSCFTLDDPIDGKTMKAINDLEDIYNVRSVNLDSNTVSLPTYIDK